MIINEYVTTYVLAHPVFFSKNKGKFYKDLYYVESSSLLYTAIKKYIKTVKILHSNN